MSEASAVLKVVACDDEFGYNKVLRAQRAAFEACRYPGFKARQDKLHALKAQIHANRERIIAALTADFGHRSRHETLIAEVASTVGHIEYATGNLAAWMRPKSRRTSIWFQPGQNLIQAQPLGVVGIMAPWNYPINLALAPLVAALAAGTRAMIKMSEYTPASTEALREILAQEFAEDEVAVFGGDAPAAGAFAALPFDHLLFTGSTQVGRKVMQAAANNLTPVTLELGGKSPVIVSADYDIAEAAERVLWGKVFNAGQTCVAPDYLLIPRGTAEEFILQFARKYSQLLPEGAGSDDFTAVIDQRNYDRLRGLLDAAAAGGAMVVSLEDDSEELRARRKLPVTLVINPDAESRIMREEIFGPLLAVVEVSDEQEAIDIINRSERPLALYYFGHSERARDKVLKQTHAGGVTVNDVMLQYLQVSQPFGGVGSSGMGSYHGEEGFRTFSHYKPVFRQRGFGGFTGLKLLYPPYGNLAQRLIRMMGG